MTSHWYSHAALCMIALSGGCFVGEELEDEGAPLEDKASCGLA